MISAVLLFFGATLIYTGYLMCVPGRQPITGLAIACIGLALIVKPALDAAKHYRTSVTGGPLHRRLRVSEKLKTRKTHLKVVKSKDNKPTIH